MSDWDNAISVWNVVPAGDLPELGKTILLRLFTEHKETKAFFPKFKDIPLEQLGNNADLCKHGETVLKALGDILKEKGNHGSRLKDVADTHINKHKVPVKYFTLITVIAVKVLTEKYPSQMTGQMQESFSKVFKIICSDLEKLYKEAKFQG